MQALQLLAHGDKNRSTGGRMMNERSSRSHAVFFLTVESQRRLVGGSSLADGPTLNDSEGHQVGPGMHMQQSAWRSGSSTC